VFLHKVLQLNGHVISHKELVGEFPSKFLNKRETQSNDYQIKIIDHD